MRIYFTYAKDKNNINTEICLKIYELLKNKGFKVFETENTVQYLNPTRMTPNQLNEWYEKYSEWTSCVQNSDVAIVEGSYPSTINIGFEIGMLIARGKPVILIHREQSDPVFINSSYSPRIIKSEYNNENITEVLDWCIEEALKLSNRRFTFYISPEIEEFLEKITRANGNSKSEYIRDLIEREMSNKKS